ncbi:hypothetical protein K502DRAFT_368648 [Neoconidiobolus thromboides FSU 785]|nr:hypothetical protein K502DRAFT_368648 [Neoconidiobolus thromboides FSU 785]
MESLKIVASLITMGFYTSYIHFTQGAPLPSWDLKTHFIYNILKKGNNHKQGKSLEEVRKIKDINIFPPSKDFDFTKTYIPDHYRELSHNIIKEKLVKEIGKYPIERKNAFWYNSEKLELELALPKIKDPNVDKETLLYLHGGAYIYGSINTHRPLFCKLGEKANCQVAGNILGYYYFRLINQNY